MAACVLIAEGRISAALTQLLLDGPQLRRKPLLGRAAVGWQIILLRRRQRRELGLGWSAEWGGGQLGESKHDWMRPNG